MRAKEFKMLMEFSASNYIEMDLLSKYIDEIYFLQSIWKKYFGEIDYLKIYPNLKFDNSKIVPIAGRIDHFLIEHKEFFSAEKTNLIFHGHIVENYKFFFGTEHSKKIDISNLIKFDQI